MSVRRRVTATGRSGAKREAQDWPEARVSIRMGLAMSPTSLRPSRAGRGLVLGAVLFSFAIAAAGCKRRHYHGHGEYGHGTTKVHVEEDPLPPPPPPPPKREPPPPPPPPPREEPRPPPKATGCGPRKPGFPTASVQGVADDDVLNVRVHPDFHSETLGSLPPDATGVIVLGHPRGAKKGSTWTEVRCRKLQGWVRDKFLALDKDDE